MVWRVFHSIIHMAREVSGRDDMRLTLCGKDGTIHFLRKYIMSEAFIYRWYDAPNDMYYLGKHKGSQDDGYTHSSYVWPRFTKDNIPEGVTREIIAEGTDEEMCVLEHKLLKFEKENGNWDRYYNESLGDPHYVDQSGENNPMYGRKLTEEEKELRRQKSLEMWQIPIEEGGRKGWKPTEEMNRHQSETKKQLYAEGKIVSWNKGKKGCFSEETRRKISEGNKGKKHSEETIKRMSEQRSGNGNGNYKDGRSLNKKKYSKDQSRIWRENNREEYNRYMREWKRKDYAKKKAERQGVGALDAFLK